MGSADRVTPERLARAQALIDAVGSKPLPSSSRFSVDPGVLALGNAYELLRDPEYVAGLLPPDPPDPPPPDPADFDHPNGISPGEYEYDYDD